MSAAACKVVLCAGSCVRFMVSGGELEEFTTHVVIPLAANNQLSDNQSHNIWPLYEEFDDTPLKNSERLEYEAKMTKILKRIVWSVIP